MVLQVLDLALLEIFAKIIVLHDNRMFYTVELKLKFVSAVCVVNLSKERFSIHFVHCHLTIIDKHG